VTTLGATVASSMHRTARSPGLTSREATRRVRAPSNSWPLWRN